MIADNEGRGMIIGNNGSLTYAVRLSFPEVYSLYKDEIEKIPCCLYASLLSYAA